MLIQLELNNFRCFEHHRIQLRETTVIVGRNNAGKSTVVEALRLVSLVANRCHGLRFIDAPDWLQIPRRYKGVSPSLDGTELTFRTAFHRYNPPPATITANFENGQSITVYIGSEDRIFALIRDHNGNIITNRGDAGRLNLPEVNILPQIAPLQTEETILTPRYVARSISKTLAPRHFRNQLNLEYEAFSEFADLAQQTWPGLRIRELDRGNQLPGTQILLWVQDGDFTAEVGSMGHGMQMWLQTMWFLARIPSDSIAILDEPDVYMHADLQRRLIRLLRRRYKQVIVATHSVEIISEVEADDVLVVDRRRRSSSFVASLPGMQKVIDHMGGGQNLQYARLWSSGRCLHFEGKDITYLKHFQNTLFNNSQESFAVIPNLPTNGWGGWSYVMGSAMFAKRTINEDMLVYCIFDSDYHTQDEIDERLAEAQRLDIQLHIWKHKEIENYLLVPSAICRIISSRILTGNTEPSVSEIAEQIDRIADDLKEETFDAIATEFSARNRAAGHTIANRRARTIVNNAWNTREGRLALVSGKEVISRLSDWSQRSFGVSFGPSRIALELRLNEIDSEVASVVRSIEQSRPFY